MSLTVLVGTTKGAFLVDGDDGEVRGPFCDGWPINHVIGDAGTGRIWAGGGGDWSGAGVWRSDDGGATWTLAKLSAGMMDDWAAKDPDFARMIGWTGAEAPFTGSLDAIWSLHLADGAVWAGGKPAQLYRSGDGGETWERNDALESFEGRDEWNPGAAGLTLHSIVTDPGVPKKMWLGISAAGVFATEDGGASWDRRNRLSNAGSASEHSHPAAPSGGETGHCVHNIARGEGDTLYQQNHHGVFRSRDGGRSWDDVTAGLPSTFGFPIAVDRHAGDRVYVLPLNGDMAGRFPPEARAAVWRSIDGGDTWEARREGLPQSNCYFTVLRQAMATDGREPSGVWFGTNSGSIFVSRDGGDHWEELVRHLPTVLSVETLESA